MACPGFNLPAVDCCPAAGKCIREAKRKGKEPICARCYATKKRYRWSNVRNTLQRRADWWKATDPVTRGRVLADAVQAQGVPRYFRCYDSGDFDLSAYDTWKTMAELLPGTVLWLPTRTWILDDHFPRLVRLNRMPNIVVRPSALCFDDPPPDVPGLAAGMSSAYLEPMKADRKCAEQCGRCRMCWTRPDLSVNFKGK